MGSQAHKHLGERRTDYNFTQDLGQFPYQYTRHTASQDHFLARDSVHLGDLKKKKTLVTKVSHPFYTRRYLTPSTLEAISLSAAAITVRHLYLLHYNIQYGKCYSVISTKEKITFHLCWESIPSQELAWWQDITTTTLYRQGVLKRYPE